MALQQLREAYRANEQLQDKYSELLEKYTLLQVEFTRFKKKKSSVTVYRALKSCNRSLKIKTPKLRK